MALTKIRGNTQIADVSIENGQIAYKNQATNPLGIELVKIQDGDLLVKSDGTVPFTAPVAGVAPVGGNDFTTKDYVDAVATGLDVKQSVRLLASTNITLAGIQPIDGVGVVAGDRVLVAGQSAPAENGIYVVSAGAWARAADADGSPASEVTSGLFTFVEEGTANKSTGWVLATANPIAVGTTPQQFVQFSEAGQITAGGGLTLTGSTVDVVSANAGIAVNANNIELKVSADGTLQVKNDGVALRTLAPGQLLVGDNNSVAQPVTLSGDVTVNSAGVVTISPGAVGAASIADHSLSLAKLVAGTAPGQLIVTDANNYPVYVTPSGDIEVGTDGSLYIKDDSVDSDALANNSVNQNKIVDGAVLTAKLADNAVTTLKLADNAVTTPKIVDGAVTLDKLETLGAARIIVGTTGGNADVVLSGDVTMNEFGVVSINPATVFRLADLVKRETPVGAVDGTNDTFTLAFAPKAGTEDVYLNGVLQESGAGNDYVLTGTSLVLTFMPLAGDKVRVSYIKA